MRLSRYDVAHRWKKIAQVFRTGGSFFFLSMYGPEFPDAVIRAGRSTCSRAERDFVSLSKAPLESPGAGEIFLWHLQIILAIR